MTGTNAFLLIVFLPAQALCFWPLRPSDSLKDVRADFNGGRYAAVVTDLGSDRLQSLRSGELAEAYRDLGQSYEKLGRTADALGVYQVGAKLFPKDILLLRSLGLLLHGAGLDADAQPLLERVAAEQGQDPAANLALAEIDRSSGLLDESADHYEKALKGYPGRAPLWREAAEVYLNLKKYGNALSAIQKALAISQDRESLFDLAAIERSSGNLGAAVADLDVILKTKPGDVPVLLAKALWLIEAARFEEARAVSEQALKESPENPLAYFARAEAEIRLGQVPDAIQDLETAEDLSQDSPFLNKVASVVDQAVKSSDKAVQAP